MKYRKPLYTFTKKVSLCSILLINNKNVRTKSNVILIPNNNQDYNHDC